MKKTLLLAAFAVCGSMANAQFWAWDLDGDTNEISGGTALGEVNAAGISYSNATIDGNSATVMNFAKPSTDAIPYLSLVNPIGGNGGGTRSNQYTVLIDINMSSLDEYHAMLQTGSSHDSNASSDTSARDNDGDWFLFPDDGREPANGLGISGDYEDAGNNLRLDNDAWRRIVLTIDTNEVDSYKSYIDGELQNVVQSPSGWGQDGRFSLGSEFWFFADNGTEVRNSWSVNNIALWDRALTESEVMDLGGATAEAVPEPATMALLATGALVALRRRKK